MSQRKLAAIIGVSPRTVGRWLREGSSEGVQRIDPGWRDAIGVAFDLHKQLARQAAKEFDIPFSPDVPVMAIRKPLRSGKPGDRVFVENAQFLDSTLRQIVFHDFANSGRAYVGSVGSTLDLYKYFLGTLAQRIEEQKRSNKAGKVSIGTLRNRIRESFENTFNVDLRTIEQQYELRMVSTEKRSLNKDIADIDAQIKDIERQIRQKHEPAGGTPGTAIGTVLIIQMERMADDLRGKQTQKPPRKTARNRRRRT